MPKDDTEERSKKQNWDRKTKSQSSTTTEWLRRIRHWQQQQRIPTSTTPLFSALSAKQNTHQHPQKCEAIQRALEEKIRKEASDDLTMHRQSSKDTTDKERGNYVLDPEFFNSLPSVHHSHSVDPTVEQFYQNALARLAWRELIEPRALSTFCSQLHNGVLSPAARLQQLEEKLKTIAENQRFEFIVRLYELDADSERHEQFQELAAGNLDKLLGLLPNPDRARLFGLLRAQTELNHWLLNNELAPQQEKRTNPHILTYCSLLPLDTTSSQYRIAADYIQNAQSNHSLLNLFFTSLPSGVNITPKAREQYARKVLGLAARQAINLENLSRLSLCMTSIKQFNPRIHALLTQLCQLSVTASKADRLGDNQILYTTVYSVSQALQQFYKRGTALPSGLLTQLEHHMSELTHSNWAIAGSIGKIVLGCLAGVFPGLYYLGQAIHRKWNGLGFSPSQEHLALHALKKELQQLSTTKTQTRTILPTRSTETVIQSSGQKLPQGQSPNDRQSAKSDRHPAKYT